MVFPESRGPWAHFRTCEGAFPRELEALRSNFQILLLRKYENQYLESIENGIGLCFSNTVIAVGQEVARNFRIEQSKTGIPVPYIMVRGLRNLHNQQNVHPSLSIPEGMATIPSCG